MAYATLLSVTQSLEHILHPNDQSLVLHETEQHIMRSLNEKATLLLSFLENDSLKSSDSNLEPRIIDVAYMAEATIEFCFSHQNYEGSKKIVEELDSVLDKAGKMMESNQVEDLPPIKYLPTASPESGSTKKTDIVGFHKEMKEIKDRLIGLPSRREIISIIGMPGIGKTTLTKTLCDDALIMERFDVHTWITVSTDYNQQQMLTGLLDSIQSTSDDDSDSKDLALHVYKNSKQRRYLIVMDDVWDTNAWDQVKRLLPYDNNGSRIILTTCLQKVADHVECPNSIYSLSLQSCDDSWKLLSQKAFNAEPCPPEFEEVGKDIANNCKGLPLSLAVIGGILYKAEIRLDYWRYVGQNIKFVLNNPDDQVMEILSLSYKHLPHHLRVCFLYMGVFCEDYAILKSRLIRLWVAEGFIKPGPSKSFEKVAGEYLENLIEGNMILVRKQNDAGEIKKCGVHDLMRDLCTRIGQEEKFFKVADFEHENFVDFLLNFSHVNLVSKGNDSFFSIYGLLTYSPTEISEMDLMHHLLSQLRALDELDGRLCVFQDKIHVDRVGLRYACFRCRKRFSEIPSSISKPLNLQTLVISSENRVILPFEIWMMPRIRHIKTRECFLPYPFDSKKAKNFVPLENLQKLKAVTNFRFTEGAIQMMPNPKKLRIKLHPDGSADLSSYCISNLVLVHQLDSLNVSFEGKSDIRYRCPLPEIHPTLKKLTLCGFRLSPKNMASIGSLEHLGNISFDGSLWEPTEGEFLQLKSLFISDAHQLDYLKADETNFPILVALLFKSCTKLKDIPSGLGYITTLRLIKLSDCSKSAEHSLKLIREEHKDLGNERLLFVSETCEIILLRILLSRGDVSLPPGVQVDSIFDAEVQEASHKEVKGAKRMEMERKMETWNQNASKSKMEDLRCNFVEG